MIFGFCAQFCIKMRLLNKCHSGIKIGNLKNVEFFRKNTTKIAKIYLLLLCNLAHCAWNVGRRTYQMYNLQIRCIFILFGARCTKALVPFEQNFCNPHKISNFSEKIWWNSQKIAHLILCIFAKFCLELKNYNI